MSNETPKPKKFWKSKTVISSAIMMLTFILDASFHLGIADTIDGQLNNIFFTDAAGEITKINWSALITLFSMLTLRFVTKKPLSFEIGNRTPKSTRPGQDLLNALKDAKNKIQ